MLFRRVSLSVSKKFYYLLSLVFIASYANGELSSSTTSLGGYGELHLNYSKYEKDVTPAPVLDFHRWVLLLNHQWTNEWSFATELELEHNFIEGGKATGELELEQAYIQYSRNAAFNFQIGVLLPSVGLINDKHEPNLFLSVERPEYNRVIIPTTWYGNGLAIRGLLGGQVNYNLVVLEGLDDRKFVAKDGIRSGRQKGYKSSLETVLINAAFDYVGLPGLNAGMSGTFNLLAKDPKKNHPYKSTFLGEIHAKYKAHGIWAQTEFGMIEYTANDNFSPVLESSRGYYIDLGYDVARLWNAKTAQLYPYFRYSHINSSGKIGDPGTASVPSFGLAFLPIEKITFKADYGKERRKGVDGTTTLVNFGAGYAF
jgi:hypothetical protein